MYEELKKDVHAIQKYKNWNRIAGGFGHPPDYTGDVLQLYH